MRPLRYAINVTLDGCCDHRAGSTDEELHRYWAESLARADALLFGRVTYEMMEAAWRAPWRCGTSRELREQRARRTRLRVRLAVRSASSPRHEPFDGPSREPPRASLQFIQQPIRRDVELHLVLVVAQRDRLAHPRHL